jgi:glycosyl transferase family 25
MRTFLSGPADFGLIVEDDCAFDDDVRDVLEELMRQAERWDVVKLAGKHSGWPVTTGCLGKKRRLVAILQRQTGSAAYLINRRAAAVYVRELLPMAVPFDHAFDQVWRYGLTLRGVEPRPAHTIGGPSTIGYGQATLGRGRKKVWYRRASVLAYRTATEARRIAHYLFSDREWMLARFRGQC